MEGTASGTCHRRSPLLLVVPQLDLQLRFQHALLAANEDVDPSVRPIANRRSFPYNLQGSWQVWGWTTTARSPSKWRVSVSLGAIVASGTVFAVLFTTLQVLLGPLSLTAMPDQAAHLATAVFEAMMRVGVRHDGESQGRPTKHACRCRAGRRCRARDDRRSHCGWRGGYRDRRGSRRRVRCRLGRVTPLQLRDLGRRLPDALEETFDSRQG